jgi:hypothetical protein
LPAFIWMTYFCPMKWFIKNKAEKRVPHTAGQELLDDSKHILSSFVLTIIAAVVTIPLFIMLYRYVPDIIIPIGKGLRIDHVLAMTLIFVILRVAAYFVRYFLYGASIVLIIVLIIGQIVGGFGFTNVYSKYRDLITYVGSNPIKIPFLSNTKTTISNADSIIQAIDYENAGVRDFAVSSSKKYFTNSKFDLNFRHIVQYFSIFRVMSSWNYVSDPIGEDYYAKASESVKLMSGDCDDYSILMAACIKAVGGEVRLIRTPNHMYPEVKVCSYEYFPQIIDLIKNRLFFKESLGERIYYHLDEWNNIWLNFDYTNIYPGGAFMSDDILGILVI